MNDKLRLLFQLNPQINAKELLKILQEERPEDFPDGLLRTLQRRLREWRNEEIVSTRDRKQHTVTSVIILESATDSKV